MIRRLLVNNGLSGSLATTFTRNVPTVDDYAQPVLANAPNFGRRIAVADYTAWQVALGPAGLTEQWISGSGKAQNGVDDLLCYVLADDHTFNIAKNHDFGSLLFTRNINQTAHAIAIHDIFKGTADENVNRAWTPKWGVLCHGCLILNTVVSDWDGANWIIKGMGIASFAIDSAAGTLTRLRKDFVADPHASFLNYPRGNQWSISSYTPDPHYTEPVLAAWICFTDYETNPGSPGGYAVLMRITRVSAGAAWVAEAAYMVHSRICAVEGTINIHAHVAVVQVKSATVLDVLISYGDAPNPNGHFLIRCSDKNDYTNPSKWTTYNVGLPKYSNQFAGGVLGPDDNHLVGSDGVVATVCSVKTPAATDDPTVVKPATDYVFRIQTSDGFGGLSLWVQSDCPEKRRNYVALDQQTAGGQEPSILFSPDGRAWAVAAEMPANTEFPHVCGNRIYLPSLSGQGGLRYIPLPKTRVSRPLRIGPGVGSDGKQWVDANDWFVDQISAGFTITPLLKVNGKWQDNGVDLTDQPPTMGRVVRVDNAGPNAFAGRFWMAGKWTGIGGPAPDPAVGPIVFRYWIKPIRDQMVQISAKIDTGNGANSAGNSYTTYPGSSEKFVPFLNTGNFVANDFGRWLRLDSIGIGNSFYLASDVIITGTAPVPGYPMPEGRNTDNTTRPDTNFTVTPLTLGPRWTVSIYALVPWDSWDSKYTLAAEVPLWTLYKGVNDHIAVVADITNSALLVRVTIAGVLSTITVANVKYWRCYPLVVCVARTDAGVEVSVRVRGDIKTGSGALSPAVPTEIRFGSPDWLTVGPIDVADGIVDEVVGKDATGRAAQMNDSASETLSLGRNDNEFHNRVIRRRLMRARSRR